MKTSFLCLALISPSLTRAKARRCKKIARCFSTFAFDDEATP
jgi:hypothetical protein